MAEKLESEEHAFIFDHYNVNWTPNSEINALFIKGVLQHANNRLQVRGHVFLNEILDALAMKRIPDGALGGWLFDDKVSYVDYEVEDIGGGDFAIKFKLQGPIYHLL